MNKMPLKKSSSKKSLGSNIKKMVKEGYPKSQAVAASLENQRRMKKKGK